MALKDRKRALGKAFTRKKKKKRGGKKKSGAAQANARYKRAFNDAVKKVERAKKSIRKTLDSL